MHCDIYILHVNQCKTDIKHFHDYKTKLVQRFCTCDVNFFSSDQTDPFNRSPLSLDMVTPDVELKTKIEKWIQEKKASS